MMARRGALGLLGGVIGSGFAAALGGCGLFGGNGYRFRMIVEVNTPEGVKNGSSVYAVNAYNEPGLDPSGKVRKWHVKGEAVAVDLPGGQTLFALLKTENRMRSDLAQMSMAALDPAFKNDIVESARRIARDDGITSPATVAPSDYPMLVTFKDINDPKSVVRVDPANLAASFGPGVTLKRITVETTHDPVTTGIGERLTKQGIEKGHGLDRTKGVTANPTLAQTLSYSHFRKGFE